MTAVLTQFPVTVTRVVARKLPLPERSINVLLLNFVMAKKVSDLHTVAGHTKQFVTCANVRLMSKMMFVHVINCSLRPETVCKSVSHSATTTFTKSTVVLVKKDWQASTRYYCIISL